MPYLKEGGRLACFSVSTSPYLFNLSRCPINYSYQHIDPETEKAIDEVCDLLEQGKIPTDIFITHKWNFDDVVEAFNTLYTDTVIKGLVFFS
jgi:Zn-dependent alcohol dehydrogenase